MFIMNGCNNRIDFTFHFYKAMLFKNKLMSFNSLKHRSCPERHKSGKRIKQTESLVKDTSQSNDTSNRQKADGTDNSGKKAKYDESGPDGNKENQAG